MKKILSLIFGFAFLLLASADANAQHGGGFSGLDDVLGESVEGDVINTIAPSIDEAITPEEKVEYLFFHMVELILFVIGIAAVIMIVIAGVRLTFSAGSPEVMDQAKKTVLYAVMGLLAAFLSFMIIRTVLMLFYGEAI